MNIYPRIESRVSAQERRQLALDARIEELSEDMTASFKQLAGYQIKTEQQIDTRFDKIENRLDKIEGRLDKIEGRLDKIETTMATKEDLAAMENRILDVFKQLLTTINTQHPSAQ